MDLGSLARILFDFLWPSNVSYLFVDAEASLFLPILIRLYRKNARGERRIFALGRKVDFWI